MNLAQVLLSAMSELIWSQIAKIKGLTQSN